MNKRAAHRAVSVGDSLYVWGGGQPNIPEVHDSEEKRTVTSNIQHFTPSTGQWITSYTTGIPPLGVREYCCTAINDQLYYFGGYCGHDVCFHNCITQLDTVSLQWGELEPTNATIPVMKRGYGGMISFEHNGVPHLLMIGGTGSKPALQQPHNKYIKLDNGKWRTNEHSIYNISSRKWSNPSIIGQCILPAYGFIMEKINNTRAVLFGGVKTYDDAKSTVSNSIYLLEISISTVFWHSIKKPRAREQLPVGRYFHAGTIIITGSDCPMLVISGGLDIYNDTLDDCWIFNITQHSWIKLVVPHFVSKRWAHSLSVFNMNPHCSWIVTVGGVDMSYKLVIDPNITVLTELGTKGEWTVGDTLDTNGMNNKEYKEKYQQQLQLGRRIWLNELKEKEREMKLNMKLKEKNRELKERNRELWEKDRELQEKNMELQENDWKLQENDRELQQKDRELQQKDRELQQKDRELQQKDRELQERDRVLLGKNRELQEKDRELQEKDKDLWGKYRELQEKDRELQEKDRELQEKDRELQEKDRELQEKDWGLQEKDRELQENHDVLEEKDRELRESQEAVRRYQQQTLTDNHWVINKDEVTLTEEELGRGSYAVVTVGIFRGLRVAVKSLHTIIISDYNLALFSREMTIASQVRHPNLVQFIGATKVDNPLILTELMSTNLNQELQRNRLTDQQILSIAQDVALGLNYLHLFKPQPIIHRDVSSPNVLLKPCSGPAGYEAKIADYGTAKLQQGTSTGTVMPGNVAYAAPEAPIPDQHSPSMDVYSYSVLLMEMNLHCPPEMTTTERGRQVDGVSFSVMKSLIQRGLNASPRDRPTMAQVIETLKGMRF